MIKELKDAIGFGDNKKAIELLQNMTSLDEADENGITPLMYAADQCNEKLVQYLVENGANVNLQNNLGESALHMVAGYQYMGFDGYEGRKKITRILLENGANPNIKDAEGNTPLHYSVFKMHHEIENTILEYSGDYDLKNSRGMGALEFAVLKKDEESVSLLIERGFNEERLECDLNVALPGVMSYKNLVVYMANHILSAINYDEYDRVIHMIENDTFFKDNLLEKIALDRASKLNKMELVNKILKAKALRRENINEKDMYGNTLLHFAVFKNNVKLARKLILHGANIGIKNRNGNTPLHLACILNRPELVEKIAARANFNDLNVLNKAGKTAMDIAEEKNNLISQSHIRDYNNINVVQNICRLKRIEPKYNGINRI